MPSLPRLICALVVCCLSLAPAWAASERRPPVRKPAAEEPYAGRVIVKYKAESALMRAQSASAAAPRPQHAATMGARLGLVLRDGWVLGPRTQALRGQGVASADLAARLAAQPEVEWAIVDGRKRVAGVVPNDTFYGGGQSSPYPAVGQWYLRAPDATFVSAINAVGAWATTIGSTSVTVAVLDTGIRPEHPDFKRGDGSTKLYAGYDFIAAEPGKPTDFTTAGDSDGRDADPSDPGDACSGDPSSWHGTQTASLIGAATDNSIGLASVGREVMIQPVRVLGTCGGYDSDIQAAMRWAAGVSADPVVNPHPAQVLNMSLGSDGACNKAYQDVFNELYAKGVNVVVAAGNGVDTPAPGGGVAVGTPANCPHAISVAGVRHAGTKVGYSNLGPENVIAAPAGNCINTAPGSPCLYPIMTATNAGTTTPSSSTYTDMFDAAIGTSFSAPQVAGAIALMLSVNASLTPDDIKLALQGGARPFPTSGSAGDVVQCKAPSATPQDECYCTTTTCGAGMLDVAASVARAVPGNTIGPYLVVSASSLAPTAGSNVTLSSAGSGAFDHRSIASYAWSVTAGGSIASISGSATGASATLAVSAAGPVTVQLTATDSGGHSSTKSVSLDVQAAPSPAPSSGGGGAFAPAWLALLALGVLALRRRP